MTQSPSPAKIRRLSTARDVTSSRSKSARTLSPSEHRQSSLPRLSAGRQGRQRLGVQRRRDGSIRWQLSDRASGGKGLPVPKTVLDHLCVSANTDCVVRVPSGASFNTRLVWSAQGGGHITRLWQEIQRELSIAGGETVSLRPARGFDGTLILHLEVAARPERHGMPQVRCHTYSLYIRALVAVYAITHDAITSCAVVHLLFVCYC